jgi:membrane protease YdiL (CAAX protease family)
VTTAADHRPATPWTAIALAIGFPSLLTWLYFVALADQARWLQQGAYTLGKTIQFAFPAVWVFWIAQRRLAMPVGPASMDRRAWRGWIEGLIFGAAVFALMVAGYRYWLEPAGLLLHAALPIRAKVAAFGIDSPAAFVALGVFYSLVHSFLEEYYWRWFVFGELRRRAPLGVAIVVSSLGFAAHHVIVLAFYFGWASWTTWGFSLAVAFGGGVWAWIYHRSGSLGAVWLSHLLIDAAIFAVGLQIAFD